MRVAFCGLSFHHAKELTNDREAISLEAMELVVRAYSELNFVTKTLNIVTLALE